MEKPIPLIIRFSTNFEPTNMGMYRILSEKKKVKLKRTLIQSGPREGSRKGFEKMKKHCTTIKSA